MEGEGEIPGAGTFNFEHILERGARFCVAADFFMHERISGEPPIIRAGFRVTEINRRVAVRRCSRHSGASTFPVIGQSILQCDVQNPEKVHHAKRRSIQRSHLS
jgi:hypothetical protein